MSKQQKTLAGISYLTTPVDSADNSSTSIAIRDKMDALITELNKADGPDVEKVDEIFQDLNADLDQQTNQIDTTEEEKSTTNFQVLKDYVVSLNQSWAEHHSEFEVMEHERFVNFTVAMQDKFPAIESIESNITSVKVNYKKQAHILGILPVDYTVSIEANETGLVNLQTPWWLFFAPGESENVRTNVVSAISSLPSYGNSTRIETNKKIIEVITTALQNQ